PGDGSRPGLYQECGHRPALRPAGPARAAARRHHPEPPHPGDRAGREHGHRPRRQRVARGGRRGRRLRARRQQGLLLEPGGAAVEGSCSMANRDPRETLIGWLNDAYAMEKGLVQVLENHADDVKDRPEMYRKIAQHLEQTKMHAERVRECVERLGGSVSTVKTAMGAVSGFFQGRSTGASPDELVKN